MNEQTKEQYFKIAGELYLRVVFKYTFTGPNTIKVDIENIEEIQESLAFLTPLIDVDLTKVIDE